MRVKTNNIVFMCLNNFNRHGVYEFVFLFFIQQYLNMLKIFNEKKKPFSIIFFRHFPLLYFTAKYSVILAVEFLND